MKLLIVTQVVDLDHPILGFFHDWIVALASHFKQVEVICLFEGRHMLPANVQVYSLGKDKRVRSRLRYAVSFLRLVWQLRKRYDEVFVHMNEEYVLLAGLVWRALGKRVYLWRNHYAGTVLTDMAAAFATKVFCTSRYSYTAKYRKTVLMPVGVDIQRFSHRSRSVRAERSILFLARMAPSKDPAVLLEALRILNERGVAFTAIFVGSPLPGDESFYRSLVGRAEHYGLASSVTFIPGVPNHQTPDLYASHAIFVNCSPSGMLDKTIFEAASAGCLVLAISEDYRVLAGEAYSFTSAADLASKLEAYLALPSIAKAARPLQELARAQSIDILTEKLAIHISRA